MVTIIISDAVGAVKKNGVIGIQSGAIGKVFNLKNRFFYVIIEILWVWRSFFMNIAIVDDMPDEIGAVKALLKEYSAVNRLETEIVSFSSAENFLKSYRPLLYTIVFMDIYMDGMTGVEAAERIRKTDGAVIIIFLTTSEDHRADALHCHAYDYLIKPVTLESLFKTMDDIMRIQTVTDRQKLMFSSQRRDYSLPYSEILYIKTESTGSNYLEIMDGAGSTYRTRMTFSAVCDTLSGDNRFLLIRSGVLVNMEHISLIKNKLCIMNNGERLPINTKKEKEIRRIWQNFMFDHIRKQSMKV